MAGDWIKMRPSLITSPKVNGIARVLEDDKDVTRALSTGYTGTMNEIVTRNVMRNVTLSALMMVWGAANEHTTDGVFRNADLSDIDDIAGIPGFGAAMVFVGWAVFDREKFTVTLPNFNEYNTCGKDRATEKNAERQRRYREKQAQIRHEERNVTNDVTRNDREEKRREEKKNPPKPPKGADDLPAGFAEFWSAYPRRVAKPPAIRAWRKLKPDMQTVQAILAGVTRDKQSDQWLRDGGQFIPYPATYLNEARWEDGSAMPTDSRPWYVRAGFGSAQAARAAGHEEDVA